MTPEKPDLIDKVGAVCRAALPWILVIAGLIYALVICLVIYIVTGGPG